MKGTTGELVDLSNIRLASFSAVSSRNGQPGADDRVDPRTDDPTAWWPCGRKDFAPQTCTQLTGAAGTYAAGTLATAYPATVYFAGYTGVGAFFAPGDAHFADQRQAAQDNQTGTSYMALNRPSTARTGRPTAHRPPLIRQHKARQTGNGLRRRQAVRACLPSNHACGWLVPPAPTRPGPWSPPTLPLPTLVWARLSPPVRLSLLTSDRHHTTTRQESHIWPQPGHRHARTNRRPLVRRRQHRPRPHRSRLTGIGLDRHL